MKSLNEAMKKYSVNQTVDVLSPYTGEVIEGTIMSFQVVKDLNQRTPQEVFVGINIRDKKNGIFMVNEWDIIS